MSKRTRNVILGLAILFLIAQAVPFPPADNPPVTAEIPAPEHVRGVLQESCYDCHSNRTTWPWYSHVIPGKWLVRQHVREGRDHLNLTEWDHYTRDQAVDQFEEIVEVLEDGEMPLRSYIWLHAGAELTADERDLLLEWARGSR